MTHLCRLLGPRHRGRRRPAGGQIEVRRQENPRRVWPCQAALDLCWSTMCRCTLKCISNFSLRSSIFLPISIDVTVFPLTPFFAKLQSPCTFFVSALDFIMTGLLGDDEIFFVARREPYKSKCQLITHRNTGRIG